MVQGNDKPHRPARLSVRVMAATFVAVAAFALPAASADFAKGVAAYDAKDFATAFREWLPLAEDGDPAAQRNVGHLYRRGLGVEKDQKQAIRWYRKAAEQGFDRAQANMAYMYLNGDGVDRDFAQAAKWFYQAAIQGHPIAQYNLGQMYQLGWGVPKDRGRAMAWYNLAAKAGHKKALDRLSVLILRSGPPKLEKDGGESLPTAMPEGEPGWDEEAAQLARSSSEADTETTSTPPKPIAQIQVPVRRTEQPLPKDQRVAVAKLAPPAVETTPPGAPTADTTEPPAAKEATPEPDEAENDEGGFFSRFFSLKAPDGEHDISGTRETQFAATPAVSSSEPVAEPEPAVQTQPAEDGAEASQAVKPAAPAQELSKDKKAASAEITSAPSTHTKPWVNPDNQPVAAAPTASDSRAPAEPAAAPKRPEIKITVINPPPEDETAVKNTNTEPAPPKNEEKGFFARLFSGSAADEDADREADGGSQSAAVEDLTALPEVNADQSDTKATDLAPKVKGVEIVMLTPPPADKLPAATPDTDKPVKAVVREPAAAEPEIPIPEPATGPTERDAKYVLAKKMASAGRPHQRADDNPQEFFAPKVTIDWNTVLKPSSSFSPPAPEIKAAEKDKGEKPKSLADSDQATLTALAAQQGLIEPLQLGLLAYRARDYNTAIKYWLPMAHSGKSRAQFYMGGLYHDGTGVERDKVQAFMWWSLAAEKGYNPALTARERLRDRMSEVEVAEAMNLVRSWRPVAE